MPSVDSETRNRVHDMVVTTLQAVEDELGKTGDTVSDETPLIGRLDSLGLVTLIVDLEERLRDDLGVTVALANERAMSAKRSPFLTVGSLVDYVVASLPESAAT